MTGPWTQYQSPGQTGGAGKKPWEQYRAAPQATASGGGSGSSPQQEAPSRLEALWHGLLRGGRDVLEGGAQIGARMGPDEGGAAFTKPEDLAARRQAVDRAVQQSAQDYQQDPARRAYPITAGAGRIGGNVAATAPLALIPGGAPSSAAGAIARGALAGGAAASLAPVQNTDDYWHEKAKQVGTGLALGGAIPTAGNALAGRLPSPETVGRSLPWLRNFFTGSEERNNSGFARTVARQVLDPIGKSNSVTRNMSGHKLNSHVEDELDNAYETIKPKLSLSREAAIGAPSEDTRTLASELDVNEGRQFENIMKNRLINKLPKDGGPLTGQAFKRVESDLSGKAYSFLGTDKHALGEALLSTVQDLRTALAKENPQLAPQLQRINEAWKMWTRMRAAAGRGATKQGTFSPGDMLQAIKTMDTSAGRTAFARGDALFQRFAEAAHQALEQRIPLGHALVHLFGHGLPWQLFSAAPEFIGRGLQRGSPVLAPAVGIGSGGLIGNRAPRAPQVGDRGPNGGTISAVRSYTVPREDSQ